MARLTFESVRKYAEDCGYILTKLSKGYDLQLPGGDCSTGYCENLNRVIEKIKFGWFNQRQICLLPETIYQEAQQELDQYIEDQACEVTIKCIYPNCEQPCNLDCDSTQTISFRLNDNCVAYASRKINKEDREEKPHHTSTESELSQIGVIAPYQVIDTYQQQPEDISDIVQLEVTKWRVIDICNKVLSYDWRINAETPNYLIASRIGLVLWRKSLGLQRRWEERYYLDREFWELALNCLLEAGYQG